MDKGGHSNVLNTFRFLTITLCVLLGAGAAFAAAGGGAAGGGGGGAAAGGGLFAPDSCDPQYYQSLEARAWLEAQREIVQNQNLIFKPDSVLAYTCFDKQLNVLARESANLLSGNVLFGGNPVDLATSLTSVVSGPLDNWLTSNFDHTYLGGRSGSRYTHDTSVTPGAYACNVMDTVWMEAKCMNFIHQSNHDGFFTFAEYVGSDFRTLPTACGSNGDFQTNIDNALVPASTPWQEDAVQTYLANIYPTATPAGANACGGAQSMVPTGLVVLTDKYPNFTQYNEQACLVNGCKYIPQSQTTGCCTRGNSCP
jgi:hypothetical protein